MMYTFVTIFLLFTKTTSSDVISETNLKDFENSENNIEPSQYVDEYFPAKYLELDKTTTKPTEDLNMYIATFNRTLKYFLQTPNVSTPSTGLATFLGGAILKRIVLQYGDKIDKVLKLTLKVFINETDFLTSHYVYSHLHNPERWNCSWYRVAQIFRDNSMLTQTIQDFNEDRLIKWIHQPEHVHGFVKDLDEATFDRDQYVLLSRLFFHGLYIHVDNSDYCIENLPLTSLTKEMQLCKHDDYCRKKLYQSPSIAYTLSHRFLNIMMRNLISRCYLDTESEDFIHMDLLCSHMYREAVYIARRGFFARDIFIEHVALCSFLGYEEVHRRAWFHKIASWIDENGCMVEDINYLARALKHVPLTIALWEAEEIGKKKIRDLLTSKCHSHPMILNMLSMAAAIRHTIHHHAAIFTKPIKTEL